MFRKCIINIFAIIRKDNKILSYLNMKSSTILQISQKTVCSCSLPNLHLFNFFPYFSYFFQDFTINAIKQLETRLTTKPSPLQDINFSYLYFFKNYFFSSDLLCWTSLNKTKREYIALTFPWKFSNILVLCVNAFGFDIKLPAA